MSTKLRKPRYINLRKFQLAWFCECRGRICKAAHLSFPTASARWWTTSWTVETRVLILGARWKSKKNQELAASDGWSTMFWHSDWIWQAFDRCRSLELLEESPCSRLVWFSASAFSRPDSEVLMQCPAIKKLPSDVIESLGQIWKTCLGSLRVWYLSECFVKTLLTNNFDEASDSGKTMIYRSMCIVKFFLARVVSPWNQEASRKCRNPFCSQSCRRDGSKCRGSGCIRRGGRWVVHHFFFSLNLEVFTCRSIAILSIKIGFDPFLLLITRDLRVLQLGVTHGQVELITAVAVGCALEVRDNGHGIHPQVPWDQWTYAEVVPVLCEGKRFRCQKLIETWNEMKCHEMMFVMSQLPLVPTHLWKTHLSKILSHFCIDFSGSCAIF